MSLYQKYRPKDFNSLVWQEFIKISLQNAIIQNKLVWAYLFYGSRGTWKTTTARILAKTVNCQSVTKDWNPCHICDNCKAFDNSELIDIIEIDAASNTWVDNIRELIEKAQFQPSYGKHKVYIIDEVHMLSKWAFNALLKTLEEPPKHVKFILATTEIHKIPETIISRTQRFDFKKITEIDIIKRLEFIAKEEWIKAEKWALELIARLSRWWLRDAISLFEQYSIWDNLKLDYLKDNLQLVGDDFLSSFINDLKDKNSHSIQEKLSFLKNKWIDVKIFIEEITFYLHNKILESLDSPVFNELVSVYDLFIDIYWKLKLVPNTFLQLEFSIIKYVNLSVKEEKIEKIKSEEKPKKEEKIISTPEVKLENSLENKSTRTEETIFNNEKTEKKKVEKEFILSVFLDEIKKDNGKWFVVMSIKSSQVNYRDWVVNIYANNEFNYNKLTSLEVQTYLKEKLDQLFSIEWLVVKLNSSWDIFVDDINEIF